MVIQHSVRWLGFFLLALIGPLSAWAQTPFYQGQTIRIVVGYSAGGSFDYNARLIARHLPRYLPGVDRVVVENKPGGGSLVAANYLYHQAEPDGLTIGSIASGFGLMQARGDRKIQFDTGRFNWLIASSHGYPACSVVARTGVDSLEGLQALQRPLKFGATRAGSGSYDTATLTKNIFNAPIEVITGYKGLRNIVLAVRQGELDGFCVDWISTRVVAGDLLRASGDAQLRPFIIDGLPDDAKVANVAQFRDLISNPRQSEAFAIWADTYRTRRPLVAPPGTPEDRVKLLRDALSAVLQDEQLLEEAAANDFLIKPTRGDELQAIYRDVLSSPEDKLEQLDRLLPLNPKS